ncbi:MAG: tetratricopeptide repeat protein [Pseudomonadota bacterium]
MDCRNLCSVLLVVLGLGGCAATRAPPLAPDNLWQDSAFNYERTLVPETRATLFALDAEVVKSLRLDEGYGRTTEARLNRLITRLYGPNGIRLAYSAGHTTGASETWHNKRGDCLSLTVLAYAAARFLGINAQMQEVRTPALVDRRDGVDFISGHVNVIVRHAADVTVNGQSFGTGSFIIDFEPQAGSRRPGEGLTEDAILARYYNNRASEYLVQKDDRRAYAYYRAAIEAAPDYAAPFGNLAQVYARHGLLADAEQLLRHAIALGGPSYAPLRSMHHLLSAQGRDAEAQHYADLLAKRQDEDPYHWMGVGMAALRDGRYRAAIDALERATALTTGFEELHYYLGVAYWRNGQPDAANKQLAAIRAINKQGPSVALLSKKLQGLSAPTAVY